MWNKVYTVNKKLMCGINVYSCQDDDWWNKLYTDSKKLVGGINVLQLVRSWWVGLMCYS